VPQHRVVRKMLKRVIWFCLVFSLDFRTFDHIRPPVFRAQAAQLRYVARMSVQRTSFWASSLVIANLRRIDLRKSFGGGILLVCSWFHV
jgi:hypothetical protein